LILEGKSVGIVAQRRRRIAMPKSLLGPQKLATADQKCGHGVAQAMEADTD
jgi:hypothetical protein